MSQSGVDTTGGRGASSGQEIKLGIVHLGKIAGKHKYMLIDVADIPFVRRFCYRIGLEVEKNGRSPKIYSFASQPSLLMSVRKEENDMEGEEYFHELLWKHNQRDIQLGYKVVHKNGVTVDNRLCNLELVANSVDEMDWSRLSDDEIERRRQDASLYRAAISQLPALTSEDLLEELSFDEERYEEGDGDSPPPLVPVSPVDIGRLSVSTMSKDAVGVGLAREGESTIDAAYSFTFFSQIVAHTTRTSVIYYSHPVHNGNGTVYENFQDSPSPTLFYECKYQSCWKMENEVCSFLACSHCQVARYCSMRCHQLDWKFHKKICKRKRKNGCNIVDRKVLR